MKPFCQSTHLFILPDFLLSLLLLTEWRMVYLLLFTLFLKPLLWAPCSSSFLTFSPLFIYWQNGEWLNDKMHGEGIYRFASKSTYQGTFKENLFHGQGTYTYADGSKYTGQWENNKMHGQGEYVDGTGVIWSGNFFNGLYDSGKTYVSLRPESNGI